MKMNNEKLNAKSQRFQKEFLVLNMEDSKTKKVANILTNDSCMKILDYLSKNEATETEIAKALSLPLSTVHYNLKQLEEAGLIIVDEFHYSVKGREVNHYKIANKYIIISPSHLVNLAENNISGRNKLKGMIPSIILLGAAAIIIKFLQVQSEMGSKGIILTQNVLEKSVQSTADSAGVYSAESPSALSNTAPAASNLISLNTEIALWFLAGGLLVIGVYLMWNYLKKD